MTKVVCPTEEVGEGIALPISNRCFIAQEGGVLGYAVGQHMPFDVLLEKLGPCVFCPCVPVGGDADALERALQVNHFVPVVIPHPDSLPVYYKPVM